MKQSRILMLLGALLALSGPATATTYPVTYTTGTEVAATSSGFTATGHDLTLTLNHSPTIGTELKVVDNTGLDFISGEFTGLTQGQDIALNFNGIDHHFVANYYGGTGNDLVLVWRDTRVYSWGKNDYGQLGNSSTSVTEIASPVLATNTGVMAGKTLVSVVQGHEHSLALSADGILYAWGRNNQGQLGDNSTTNRNEPVEVNTTSGSALYGHKVIAIAAGTSHTLALRADGKVVAWGENTSGALGTGTGTGSLLIPTEVATGAGSALSGKTVIAIKAGAQFSMALCSDGTVATWGRNVEGQLGMNEASPYSTGETLPKAVNTASGSSALYGKTVVAIAAAEKHAMALRSDGKIVTWGDNTWGQLGVSTTPAPALSRTPVAVNTMDGALYEYNGWRAVKISGGGNTSIAIRNDGIVVCWGYNGGHQFGNGAYNDGGPLPTRMRADSGAATALFGRTPVQIANGTFHTEVLCSDGTLTVSGARVGDGHASSTTLPKAVPTTAMALDERFIGAAAELGNFHFGALVAGPGATTPSLAVQYPAGTDLEDSAEISYGTVLTGYTRTKTITIKNTGTASLVGVAATVDAGASTGPEFTISSIPNPIGPGTNATFTITFAPTYDHTSIAAIDITATNTADSLRLIVSGIAGTEMTETYGDATHVPLTASSVTLSAQTTDLTLDYAPAVGTNLTVIRNTGLAFINGTFADLAHGQQVVLSYAGKDYYFVADYYGGDGNDLVLHWEGTRPYAWGDNSIGKLGDNTLVAKTGPVPVVHSGVLAGKTVLRVAAGSLHTLALLSDGNVASWGENVDGQLGTGNNTDSSVPVLVSKAVGSSLNGKTVVAIAAGWSHSLALCSDGTVHAWGYNASGQLGNNSASNVDSNLPVAVKDAAGTGTLSGIVAIAAGSGAYHSLALHNTGIVYAWGRNSIGCLGDGTTTTRKLPVSLSAAGTLSGKTVTQLAVGLNFSLVLCSDNTLHSWGEGGSYQLGTGTTADRNTPGAVSTVSPWPATRKYISITAGDLHAAAICNDKTEFAWGSDTYEQTLTGATFVSTPSAGAHSSLDKIRVSAGQHFTLIVCNDGTIACRGRNHLGQLGMNSSMVTTTVPWIVSHETLRAGQRFVDAAAGLTHAIALVASPHTALSVEESLKDDYAAGSTLNFGAGSAYVTKTLTVHNRGNVSVSGLAVSIDGPEYWAFSKNTTGMATSLAPGASTSFTVTANPSTGSVSEAGLHITSSLPAALADFDVGLSVTGLGSFNATFHNATEIPITAPSVTATGTLSFTLNLSEGLVIGTELTVIDNTGRNPISGTFSNLAHGQEVVLTGLGIGYLFVADYHGGDGNDLVLHWQDSKLHGWGYNGAAALGMGDYSNRTSPAPVHASGVLAGKTVVKVCNAESSHALALCSDGTLVAWGTNDEGQLGDNTLISRTTPVLVHRSTGALAGKNVVDIATGTWHSLALCDDGTVAAWGSNDLGMLGDNTLTDRKIPTLVNTGTTSALYGKTVVQIATAGSSSVALCSDGTVAVWGDSNGMSLGIGWPDVEEVKLPTAVNTTTGGFAGKNLATLTGTSSSARYVLCTDGSIVTWGYYAQGTGRSNLAVSFPVIAEEGVSALHGQTITSVHGNRRNVIALGRDGKVFAAGEAGFVGDNTSTTRYFPVEVNTESGISALHGRTVRKLSQGYDHSYVLCTDGSIATWGSNDYAQLGIGAYSGQITAPVLVDTSTLPPDARFSNLAENTFRSSFAMVATPQAVLQVYEEAGLPFNPADDTLRNDNSTTSLGTIYIASGVTVDVTGKSKAFRVYDIGTKPLDSVSISIVGTNAAYFSLDSSEYPLLTVTYTPPVAGSHTAALRITSNAAGGLATYDINLTGSAGTTYADAVYDDGGEVPLSTTVPFTATGTYLNYTLKSALYGQDLMLVNNTSTSPVIGTFSNLYHGATLSRFIDGRYHDFVVNYYGGDGNDVVLVWKKNRSLGWGENATGQLGTASTTDRALPWPVTDSAYTYPGVLEGKTILSTAVGGGHTLVLCDDNRVYAWGDNQYGQLGDNTTTNKSAPVAVDTTNGVSVLAGRRVLAIAAGKYHSMAMYLDTTPNPDVVCVATWGLNSNGQLGDDTTTNRSVPVAVYAAGTSALYNSTAATRESVHAIAAGDYHSMALFRDTTPATPISTIATWGLNNSRQLGHNNAATYSDIPVNVYTSTSSAFVTLKNATHIAAGGNHCLAIRSDGAAVAWGLNTDGQVGNSSTATAGYPVPVNTAGALSGKTVTDIAGGFNHSVAVCSDNTVVTWGGNAGGQLGNNSTTGSSVPVQALSPGGNKVKKLAGGNLRSLALYADGALYTWGGNTNGRLGSNGWVVDAFGVYTYPDSLTPVLVSRSALAADERIVDVAEGPSADHGFLTAARFEDDGAFVAALNGYVLDSNMDTLHLGPTGPGSSVSDPLYIDITNTGTQYISSSFSLFVADDVDPGNAFQFTSYLGSYLDRGDSSGFHLYRSATHPGDHDGTLSIYNSSVGTPSLLIHLDGF